MQITVRAATPDDSPWIAEELVREFHGPLVERLDELIDAGKLPALVAELDGDRGGVLTYILHSDHGEIFTLSSRVERRGVGTELVRAAEKLIASHSLGEVRLFAINSNLHALGFYQRRGYRLWTVHRDSITDARRNLKPEIPLVDDNGIVIADEIELRKTLN